MISQESTRSALPPASTDQSAILGQWSQPLLVVGGPGSGKTTLLAHAALAQLRQEGPDPVLLASTRSAASQLRNTITAELGAGSWQPMVTTVHALSRSLWQRFSGRPQLRLLNASEQEFRVRELLSGSGWQQWPATLVQAIGTKSFAAQVRAALARARQLGLEPEDLISFGQEADKPQWSALGEFFNEYLDVLDAEEVLDYAELVHRVRLLLGEPQISKLVRAEIGAVLVDDYAELDPAQVGLIAALAPGAPMLAAADPDSVSATFRGADPRAIREFEQRFASPGVVPRVVQLAGSYRYGTDIGDAVAKVRSRLPRALTAADPELAPSGPTGEVRVFSCADEAEQTSVIATQLRRARLDSGIGYPRMAVLVRSGRRQIGSISRSLVAAGIPVEVAGDEIPLIQAPAVRPLFLGLSVAAAGAATPDEAVRLLTGPLGGFDAVSLRGLVRQWRSVGQGEDYQPMAQQVAAALNDPSWLGSVEPSAESARLLALAELLSTARELLAAGREVDVVAWHLWQGTDWPDQLAAESAQAGVTASRADSDLDALCAFFDAAAVADRRGGVPGVRAFLAELASQQIPADREREARLRHRGVQVLTAHRARGQQWDLVVVAGVQEGLWPVGRRLSVVLDADELGSHGLSEGTDSRQVLAAERRLFHLACSRARRKLVVTASAGTEGESETPSRFLAELGVPVERPTISSAPVTLPGLVAQLRRFATDAEVSQAVRSAAAIELARLSQATDDGDRLVVPAADPATWWGVRELSGMPTGHRGRVRLSPSQVNAALTCPRRYFLSRQAGGEGTVSLAATLGSLIHRLVQLSVDQSWSSAQMRDQLDQLWGRLPFEAAWFSASERVEVESALERFVTWRAARAGQLVAVEAPFHVELDLDGIEVSLAGQVDWLEQTEAGLRVADFKTSKRQPSREEIAGMEQLGIYQLAISAGGFTSLVSAEHCAVPVGASAVYLRQPGRGEEGPKEFWQAALSDRPYLSDDPSERAYPTWVHQRVAAAARVVAEGKYPATGGSHCQQCAFATSCPADDRGRQVLR